MAYPNKLIKAFFPTPSVLVLSMNRPGVNALCHEMWVELKTSFDLASTDSNVRCIIFASELEKFFTAGLDLNEATRPADTLDVARTTLNIREHVLVLQECVTSIESCRVPVIGACHGYTFGGGIDLLATCDVRYAASNTIFSIKEVDIGVAADVGTLQRLPAKTGQDSLLRELAFSARNFSAEEAYKLGLVSKVVEGGRKAVFEAALEMAKIIAAKSPVAIVGTKHLLNYSKDHTIQEGLNYTALWNAAMAQTEDMGKAYTAFKTKKPTNFSKL